MAEVVTIIRVRVLRLLARRGVIDAAAVVRPEVMGRCLRQLFDLALVHPGTSPLVDIHHHFAEGRLGGLFGHQPTHPVRVTRRR